MAGLQASEMDLLQNRKMDIFLTIRVYQILHRFRKRLRYPPRRPGGLRGKDAAPSLDLLKLPKSDIRHNLMAAVERRELSHLTARSNNVGSDMHERYDLDRERLATLELKE
jgi:hypothetical protein